MIPQACTRFPCPSPGCEHCDPLIMSLPVPDTAPPPYRPNWECPRCHKINARGVEVCDCSQDKREGEASGNTGLFRRSP